MSVEDLFQQMDRFLGLTYLPKNYSMVLFLILSTLILTFLFRFVIRGKTNSSAKIFSEAGRKKLRNTTTKVLLFSSFIVLFYRAAQLFYSVEGTASLGYIVGSVIATIMLMLLILFNDKKSLEKLLIIAVILFVVTGEPLETSISNGAKIGETMLDSVNILITGHWSFSFHSPVYSFLPYDSVVDVILTSVVGAGDATNFLVQTIVNSCLATTFVLIIILFISYLGLSGKTGLLTGMMLSSLPYLQFSIPPTNYSFVFMIFFIMMLGKCLSSKFTRSSMVITYVFLASAILAHQMAILLLIVPMLLWMLKRNNLPDRRFSSIVLVGALVFMTINLYPTVAENTFNFLRIYFLSITRSTVAIGRVSSFQSIPLSIQLVYLLPMAIVGAYLVNLFVDTVFKRGISSRRWIDRASRAPSLLTSLYLAGSVGVLLAGLSFVGTFSLTKPYGIFAYVCIGLGTAPIFAILERKSVAGKLAKMSKTIIILVMIMTVTLGILTPHKLPDQYTSSASLRGGTLGDYTTTEFLANVGAFTGNISEIDFVVHSPGITENTLSLAIPVSILKYTLLCGLEKPPTIVFHVYDYRDSDQAANESLKSLVYNSGYYEMFINGSQS